MQSCTLFTATLTKARLISFFRSPDSSVRIVIRLGLDNLGFNSWEGQVVFLFSELPGLTVGTPSLALCVCHSQGSHCMKLLIQLQLLLAEVKNEAAVQLLMFAVMSCQGTNTFFFSCTLNADRWRALVNAVMNLRVPQNVGNFLTS
jgi:hypothetical protein